MISKLRLPIRVGEVPFAGLVRLSYMTPLGNDVIAFGMRFAKIANKYRAGLDRFIMGAIELPPES